MIRQVIVYGNSMQPTLKPFDIVLIGKAEEYEAGNIIVFEYKEEERLIHRLILISKDRYYCKGDNSGKYEVIRKEQIIGKVMFVKREGRLIKVV